MYYACDYFSDLNVSSIVIRKRIRREARASQCREKPDAASLRTSQSALPVLRA